MSESEESPIDAFCRLAAVRELAGIALGLPVELRELLDALSLIVAEDPICAGDYLQCIRDQLWNVDGFLTLYDRAAGTYPELLTPRQTGTRP